MLLFAFPIGATAQRAGGMPSGGSQAEIDATHLQFSIMDLQVSQARHQGEGQELVISVLVTIPMEEWDSFHLLRNKCARL